MCRFKPFRLLLLLLFVTFDQGFAQQSDFTTLVKEGDIVFQHLNGGELSRAIDKVTDGYGGHDYNHCGLVLRVGDTLKVIEAIGQNVHLSSLSEFEKRCPASDLLIGRLLPEYRFLLAGAEQAAFALLGVPYDDYFEIGNGKLYCSELIYEAFKQANKGNPFFVLQPMTFKDPDSNQFFPSWIDYYRRLNFPIPQGKPGINPGLLSKSGKLIILSVSDSKQ